MRCNHQESLQLIYAIVFELKLGYYNKKDYIIRQNKGEGCCHWRSFWKKFWRQYCHVEYSSMEVLCSRCFAVAVYAANAKSAVKTLLKWSACVRNSNRYTFYVVLRWSNSGDKHDKKCQESRCTEPCSMLE